MNFLGDNMSQTLSLDTSLLVRILTERKMDVGQTYVRRDGTHVLSVNGFMLTVDQLREMENANELTSWGITEFAKNQTHQ